MSAHIRKNSCELFLSDGCTATSAGGNPKMSQPWPTSTCVSFRVSRRKARSASGFLLLMTECAPVIMIALALKSVVVAARRQISAAWQCGPLRFADHEEISLDRSYPLPQNTLGYATCPRPTSTSRPTVVL